MNDYRVERLGQSPERKNHCAGLKMEELWIIVCEGKSDSYLKRLECLYKLQWGGFATLPNMRGWTSFRT